MFFKPEEAYAAAAERFFELMKTFGAAAGTSTDWKAFATPLATQFERWLQMSQATTPWVSAAMPGICCAWPQVPWAWLMTNAWRIPEGPV